MNEHKRSTIIQGCKDRCKKDGNAYIGQVAKAVLGEDVSYEETERIAYVMQNSGEYVCKNSVQQGWYVFENPNHKLEQSVLSTNESARNTNYWVKRMAIASTLVAATTGVFIAWDVFIKNDSPDLQPLYQQLQQQTRILDSMQRSQKDIATHIQKISTDTILVKKKRR